MKRSSLLLALVVAVVILGCDSDGSDGGGRIPSQVATFEASITGDLEMDIDGTAYSGVVASRWGLTMTIAAKDGYGAIVFLRNGGLRPEPGTYTIGGLTPAQDFYTSPVVDGLSFTAAPAGTVVITVSTPTNVRGTFEFDAAAGTVGNPTSVHISGGFNATNHAQTE